MHENGNHKYGSDIELGKRYRDPQTGIKGVARQAKRQTQEERSGMSKQPIHNQPMVGESPITGDFFYFSRWRATENGMGIMPVGPKKDVSESVAAIISHHTAALRAAMDLAREAIEAGKSQEAAEGLRAALERNAAPGDHRR